jgi:hypothetical protein
MKYPKPSFLSLSLLTLALVAPLAAHATAVHTRIFRVESPSAPGMEHEVLATSDGRVYYAPSDNLALLDKLRAAAESKEPLSLITAEDGERIVDAMRLEPAEAAKYADDFDRPQVHAEAIEAMSEFVDSEDRADAVPLPQSLKAARALGYEPTLLSSVQRAQELFASERELKHKSQCYERAHVWSREMERFQGGIKSMKVFMFFTERFRHRYTRKVLGLVTRPYKWWFHVAPFVYVDTGTGPIQEYVLDREFLPEAVPMNDWTFEFIGKVKHVNKKAPNPTYSEALCQDAATYADYSAYSRKRLHPRYCVLRKVPMYYFQPRDLDALDCQPGSTSTTCLRTTVDQWRPSELKWAYKNTKL